MRFKKEKTLLEPGDHPSTHLLQSHDDLQGCSNVKSISGVTMHSVKAEKDGILLNTFTFEYILNVLNA